MKHEKVVRTIVEELLSEGLLIDVDTYHYLIYRIGKLMKEFRYMIKYGRRPRLFDRNYLRGMEEENGKNYSKTEERVDILYKSISSSKNRTGYSRYRTSGKTGNYSKKSLRKEYKRNFR